MTEATEHARTHGTDLFNQGMFIEHLLSAGSVQYSGE